MTAPRTFNIYCDESCHLEHDHIPVMAWGAVSCPARDARAIAEAVRELKVEHGLAPDFEAKWSKVSPAQVAFYLALIDLFLSDERLRFRGLVVPDKSLLDHAGFDQSHDEWYYKMYFTMLRPIFTAPHRYRIYIDVKDTRGGPKTRKLHEVLANSLYDFDRECIERVQQVRSHERTQRSTNGRTRAALRSTHCSGIGRNISSCSPSAAIIGCSGRPIARRRVGGSGTSARSAMHSGKVVAEDHKMAEAAPE